MKTTLHTVFFILLLTGCAASNDSRNPSSQENSTKLYQLAKNYDLKRDYYKAAKLYKRAASLGHAAAQNALGVMYSKSRGVNHNRAKAISIRSRSIKR